MYGRPSTFCARTNTLYRSYCLQISKARAFRNQPTVHPSGGEVQKRRGLPAHCPVERQRNGLPFPASRCARDPDRRRALLPSRPCFCAAFTYDFPLDKTHYLNHLYLVCLVSLLLSFIPANRVFSLARLRLRSAAPGTVPRWSLLILQA